MTGMNQRWHSLVNSCIMSVNGLKSLYCLERYTNSQLELVCSCKIRLFTLKEILVPEIAQNYNNIRIKKL